MSKNETNTPETNTPPEVPETPKDERVEVYIPKGYANEDPNMFVSVNGVNYLLPRGKKSMVPPHIKAEIERSLKAQEIMDEHIDQMIDKSK